MGASISTPSLVNRAQRRRWMWSCALQSVEIGASTVANRSTRTSARSAACPARIAPSAKNAMAIDARRLHRQTSAAMTANAIALDAISSPEMNASRGRDDGDSSCTLEGSEGLDVVRVGEEVEEVERGDAPTRRGQPARVACECYRIAREITNHLRSFLANRAQDLRTGARPRRIEEDELRLGNVFG